jgi:hypothetical protein
MSTDKPTNSEQALDTLLHRWEVRQPLPPGFEARVWRQVARTEAVSAGPSAFWIGLEMWLRGLLGRGLAPYAYITALVLLGLAGGTWQAAGKLRQERLELRALYIQSVDPYHKSHD